MFHNLFLETVFDILKALHDVEYGFYLQIERSFVCGVPQNCCVGTRWFSCLFKNASCTLHGMELAQP